MRKQQTKMKRLAKQKMIDRENFWAHWMRDLKDQIIYPGLKEYMSMRSFPRIPSDNIEKFLLIYELIDLIEVAKKEGYCRFYNRIYGDNNSIEQFSYFILIKKLEQYDRIFHKKCWSRNNPYYHSKLINQYIQLFKSLPDEQSLESFLDLCSK